MILIAVALEEVCDTIRMAREALDQIVGSRQ